VAGSLAGAVMAEFRLSARLRRASAAAVLALLVVGVFGAGASCASAATWYVRSGARPPGNGGARSPFPTLRAVEAAAAPGDTIVVEPAPVSVPPLDGGIELKSHQVLVGGGPPVRGHAGSLKQLPVLTNTTGTNLGGDAVRLADGTTVENLVIEGAYRGGIYGSDVSRVTVKRNDVSGTNTSCTTGFVVAPFDVPTTIPGEGIPFSSGLPNGWAAIMIDERHTAADVAVADNAVHDAGCADGIDIRAFGTANVSARVDDNTLTDLKQGSGQESVLAIGMQTSDTSRLAARVDGNTESYIGSATVGDFGEADSEGLFANASGRSRLTERAEGNTFAHGLGHISANCVEAVSSNGGPTMSFSLTNSTCNYVVGDVLEADNLSANATLTFAANHVIAANSTFPGGLAQAQVEPGDDGDCMLEAASGAASDTSVEISNSQLSNCTADGLGVISNVTQGTGPVNRLGFDVENSRITANQASNLRVENVTPIDHLEGKIEHTDLSESPGSPVILRNLETTGATNATLDLGGGRLGSQGHNCILGGDPTDATTIGYNLAAEHDWWGQAGGPSPASTLAAGGTIDSSSPLAGADCGPTPGSTIGPKSPAAAQFSP
jgi:hypothetical protein